MAFQELLEWSANRPAWQQDALRRLAERGETTEEDLRDLKLLVEQTAGLEGEGVLDSSPLTEEHLTAVAEDEPRTVLVSLGPVRKIDRLAEDQPPLRFALNGITLIYGANASGKSGYCRITKQLCRSLTPMQLRGNIYEAESGAPQTVCLALRVGDDQKKVERTWDCTLPSPQELSRIAVFDTASARVYVDKERRIEFLPYELDLMNKLGLACRALNEKFAAREELLDAAIAGPLPGKWTEGTAVQLALAKLVPETALEALPSEQELRDLAGWKDELQAELDATTEQLENDPVVLVQSKIRTKQALETVKGKAEAVVESLGDAAIAAFMVLYEDAQSKAQVAKTAAREIFAKQPIANLGSDPWRQMLKYAREFAAEAFEGSDPPQLATGGACVLCQQALDDAAAQRLRDFDEFILGRAAEDSATASIAFERARDALLNIRVAGRAEVEAMLAGFSDINEASETKAQLTADFFETGAARLRALQAALKDEKIEDLQELPGLGQCPVEILTSEIDRFDAELLKLRHAERDEEQMQALKIRRAELVDRCALHAEADAIVLRRSKLEERQRVRQCRSACQRNVITRRITERRREIITPSLKTALDDELRKLRLSHLPLDLSDRGADAESIVEVALTAQQRIANNSEILSEGEQRALALACFLAELSELGTTHGIIVDDPVSSLDDGRMQAVAERLAEEAQKGRQVIVFTHNILFHHMLWTEARRAQVGRHREWMSSRGGNQFGLIDEAQKPWQMKKAGERLQDISAVKKQILEGDYDPQDQKRRPQIVQLYTMMRETWERVIEEVLFNNVVQRFRPEVMTQSLEQAPFDHAADYPRIFEGMKRCSHYSGHDPAPDLPVELPQSDAVASDVEELSSFYNDANERRKKLVKSPKYEAGVEPELL